MSVYYNTTPVCEVKEKALENIRKLSKKNDINPIVIEGRTIAKNWWGKAWCEYLKKYADYDNRIARGKSYVSNGFIIDLKVVNNNIEALVQGSRKKPYNVSIEIDKCNNNTIKKLQKTFAEHIECVDDLLNGNFPKELGNSFLESELFPKPKKEIDFSCSCPDYAYLCKHISCVLYGIGAKLDKNPEVLFDLRGVKIEELVASKLKKEVEFIADDKIKSTRNTLNEDEVNDLFGLN